MVQVQPALQTQWFDGRSPRGRSVRLWVQGDELHLLTHDGETGRRYALEQVLWPERRSHGQRQTELPDGGLIQHANAAEWDDWWLANIGRESVVVGWMQSWRATLIAMAGTVAFLAAAWVWGVPVLSTVLARMVPASLEERIGQESLAQLDGLFLQPSQLPEARQNALRKRFARAVERAYPDGDAPAWQLSFHRSKMLGANAFALPGGSIVVTDGLVELLDDQPDAIVGVMGHELGHVAHRDGLDLMVRAGLLSALLGLVVGDASSFLATVPATLATQAYSRDAERRADASAAHLLHANGVPPAVMALFFERMLQQPKKKDQPDGAKKQDGKDGASLPIAISSHPDHGERIRYFREWQPDTQP